MKNFKLLVVALVAMFGFIACDKHECNDYDHSADLVGTWTCHEAGYAEALVIKADGSAVSTGVENGEFWENVKGNIVVENGNITMTFEDNDNFKGHFDIIPGMAFSIYNEDGERMTYNYCANDLADEIVGMWVWHGGENATIQTFTEDGKLITTSAASGLHDNLKQQVSEYKVVGDLRFHIFLEETIDHDRCVPARLIYTPNGTTVGDVMSINFYATTTGDFVETTKSFIRVKQSLNLVGKKYDYDDIYVTNVKGLDKDIDFIEGVKFNFAKMDGSMMDEILKSILFAVEFPDAQTFKYSCRYPEQNTFMEADMVVDGNKMTVKISPRNAAFRDIEMYVFQDADDSQMHMYMSTTAFINFFGNMQATMMAQMGQLDLTDAAAVNAIYDSIDDAVDTINVSFTFKAAK